MGLVASIILVTGVSVPLKVLGRITLINLFIYF